VNVARNGLSKTQIKQTARQAITGIQYTYSGPLPHPEVLEHYDRIVPGGAERIFTQFESQAKHRQSIESRVIRSNSLTLPSECVALSWAGLEDFISPRGGRGGGNVGIGFIDFQGLWEGRETALSFSSLSMNRHFHGLPRSA
jgi:hypothetical protein